MVDTIRSLSAIQTLLADNTIRAISEADLRDAIYSALGATPYVSKTTAYTLTEDDQVVTVDATAGAVTITLPAVGNPRFLRAGLHWH